ncbi:Uncharacterized protein OBRU01_19250, partial [Operophtera brumata]
GFLKLSSSLVFPPCFPYFGCLWEIKRMIVKHGIITHDHKPRRTFYWHTAKAISKSGADMKPAPAKPICFFAPVNKHLNWRAPPQNYRPKGNPRMKQPAFKDRLASSSKPSCLPAHHRSRNCR